MTTNRYEVALTSNLHLGTFAVPERIADVVVEAASRHPPYVVMWQGRCFVMVMPPEPPWEYREAAWASVGESELQQVKQERDALKAAGRAMLDSDETGWGDWHETRAAMHRLVDPTPAAEEET